jgi:hypothetical protein
MIEDRILTRTVQMWCEESKQWITETERLSVQVRWPANAVIISGGSWKLESRSFGLFEGSYTCNGSPKGCESVRFGGCEYHNRPEGWEENVSPYGVIDPRD